MGFKTPLFGEHAGKLCRDGVPVHELLGGPTRNPLDVVHGAPLRLRCENELGFKMVKWIAAIEFVADFADLGAGQGGYNEDHEFYGYRMPI